MDCTLPAKGFRIDGAAAIPPCALPAAGRFPAVFVWLSAFPSAPAGFGFLAALLWAARFRPRLTAEGVAFFGAADLPGALAFRTAGQRLLVAAMIRARSSGLAVVLPVHSDG